MGKVFALQKLNTFMGLGKKLYAISSVEWTDKKFYSMKILSKTCSCWQFQRFVAMINSPIFSCFSRVFSSSDYSQYSYTTHFSCQQTFVLGLDISSVLRFETKKAHHNQTSYIHITAPLANLECIIESSSLNYSWKSA